ncbi:MULTISPECIES: hypothetical protein [unclassified Streptomyces]|uniref:hypothetical protein n=1 Tax=unclassified Streptomyces TaxID=2593676 RepID=UPI002E30E566|nr:MULTISPECIES: hypothetical protein [unclassified Streptomyces]WUC63387.1 hypothetical protein OG861_03680 [Streptomyces sp. NBC_00539]
MRDPHTAPPTLAAPPGSPGAGPALPPCPVCAGRVERISWRERPGESVVLVLAPCGHRHATPAPPLLAVTHGPALEV